MLEVERPMHSLVSSNSIAILAMKMSTTSSLCILVFLLMSSLCNINAAATSSSSICNLTPHRAFCESNSPSNTSGNDIHDYCRFFVQKSLSLSLQILKYVSSHSDISSSTLLALQDCKLLAELNQDFLSTTLSSLNSPNTNSFSSKAEDFQTLLSATITNLETCSDGLQETTSSSSDNYLQSLLLNGTMFQSISLALLFKQGWANSSKTGRKLTEGYLAWDQRLYEVIRTSGRKLLQYPPDNVLVSQRVVVNPDGSANYTTINDAVNAAPNNTDGSTGFFLIYVVAGIYEEYVSIPKTKKYLMMVGDGINQTVITGNNSVGGGSTTFNSATFATAAQGFVAVNITFRNTAGASNGQAVAMRSDSDLSAFYYCSFEAYQDTLYTHSMRQFYRNCDIYGTVDFIFGNAAVVLQQCNIYPRLPLAGQYNTITAQGRTDINQNTGTSIHNCTITAASDLAASDGTTKTYLGRPWKQYSLTVYMQSFMDSLIDPAGWHEWSGTFALDTLYYAEFDNWGPGSNTSNRVTWTGYHIINVTDAVNFTVSNFIQGDAWLPATAVPYDGGLLD